ncbi:MAG: tetratricopeptide repeat protein [Acidobacteriia bacterium]|nr:tetratricopeptide repeat protein [Terriglobia bacterium]
MRRLLLLGAIALCACHRATEHPRTLRVLVAADPTFRERSNWREVITSRLHEVSSIYAARFGISLELAGASEWSPEPQLSPEEKRRRLSGYNSDGNAVFLGFAAPVGDGAEPGVAVSFDPRVLVFDFPARSERQNELFLAHELGHMFGAWHSPDGSSLLHLPPGASFDDTTTESIRLSGSCDFRAGAAGLSHETADQVAKLWSASNSNMASNPLLDSYMHMGHELLNTGHVQQAIEPLSRAIELAPGDENAHYMLASADLALNRFAAAAGEFRKVVELNPRHVTAWNNLGGALLESGQPEEAVAAFRKALEMGPPNQTIRSNIATALVRTPGHLDEAIAELQEVLRKDPNEEHAREALTAALAARQRGLK